MEHQPPAEEERIAKGVGGAAFAVHSDLGPGLLESVYEVCFCHEPAKRGRSFCRQVAVSIVYDGVQFDEGLRLDALVEDKVVCELKATEDRHPVFAAQLKLTRTRRGFPINSNVPLIKDGIERVIL